MTKTWRFTFRANRVYKQNSLLQLLTRTAAIDISYDSYRMMKTKASRKISTDTMDSKYGFTGYSYDMMTRQSVKEGSQLQ